MIWRRPLPKFYSLAFSQSNRFYSSQSKNQSHLLSSQFHNSGIKHFQKTKLLQRSSALFEIDKLITELEKRRQMAIELKDLHMIKEEEQLLSKPECTKYFEIYQKLVEKFKQIKIRQEWAYNIIGWYNMQAYYELLVQQLLGKGDKTQYLPLIQSINWMKPHHFNINTEQPIQQIMKQKNRIDYFYKNLNYAYPISLLRQIQSILGEAMTHTKSKFYHQYTLNNSNTFLRHSPQPKNQQEIDDILWNLEMYVSTYNDSPQVIKQFQDYFLTLKESKNKIGKTFIKIYGQMGRTNPQIYSIFIKPLLASNPSNVIDAQILNLQFLIHSQINDSQALNTAFKHIAKIARTQAISNGQRLHIHYLTHYLKIKGIHFAFPYHIFREFSQICRTFQEDATLAKQMAIQLDQKSRREGVEYYNSSCVLKKKLFEGNKKEVGQQIKQVQGFKQYKNIKFCCLNIELCVFDQQNKKGIILQKNYHKFNQSGRLIRMQQVKDVVLRHYGFEINYLQTREEQAKRSEPLQPK